jgi:hypothetical protein
MNQAHVQEAVSAVRIAAGVRRSLELGERVLEAADARQLIPAWGVVALSFLCVCAMVVAGALGSRGCRVTPIPLVLGVDTDISITMPAPTPCMIVVRGGNAVLDNITIDAPPARGTLTPRGRTGVIYRPSSGFKGDDAFAFSLRGRASSINGSSVVRVRAKIG